MAFVTFIFGLCAGLLGIISIISWCAVYVVSIQQNGDTVPANCTFLRYSITQTATRTYSYTIITYITGPVGGGTYELFPGYTRSPDLIGNTYPINKTVPCYTNAEHYTFLAQYRYDTHGALIASIVLSSLFGFSCLLCVISGSISMMRNK